METFEDWLSLNIGQIVASKRNDYWVIRVPGGWVIRTKEGLCFVPVPLN